MPSDPSDLRATGDAMQSALSRLTEFVEKQAATSLHVHYEVMACIPEAKGAIEDWTALRRQDAVPARRPRVNPLNYLPPRDSTLAQELAAQLDGTGAH